MPAAVMIYPPLFVLADLLTFDLALTHGITPVCAKGFVDCGMIQGDHDARVLLLDLRTARLDDPATQDVRPHGVALGLNEQAQARDGVI